MNVYSTIYINMYTHTRIKILFIHTDIPNCSIRTYHCSNTDRTEPNGSSWLLIIVVLIEKFRKNEPNSEYLY